MHICSQTTSGKTAILTCGFVTGVCQGNEWTGIRVEALQHNSHERSGRISKLNQHVWRWNWVSFSHMRRSSKELKWGASGSNIKKKTKYKYIFIRNPLLEILYYFHNGIHLTRYCCAKSLTLNTKTCVTMGRLLLGSWGKIQRQPYLRNVRMPGDTSLSTYLWNPATARLTFKANKAWAL